MPTNEMLTETAIKKRRLKASDVAAQVITGTLYYMTALGVVVLFAPAIKIVPLIIKCLFFIAMLVVWRCLDKGYRLLWRSPMGLSLGRREKGEDEEINFGKMWKYTQRPLFKDKYGRLTDDDRKYLRIYARINKQKEIMPSLVYLPLAVTVMICLGILPPVKLPQLIIAVPIGFVWLIWLYMALTSAIRAEKKKEKEKEERRQKYIREIASITDEQRKTYYQRVLNLQKANDEAIAKGQTDETTLLLKDALDELTSDFEEYEEGLRKEPEAGNATEH